MAVTLASYLSYSDAEAAIVWLEALGFTVVARQDGEHDTIQHAELRLDDAVIMIASSDADYFLAPLVGQSTGSGLYLATDNVDGMYAAAIEAGAQSVIRPEDTGWGSRRARVLDPGGREWSFGSYEPGGP
ncbi:VOC family protein [Leifsonia sp. RAF41]|uniref:VOC family protein n=1 Tax=Leifsonia sp. RAF41 TaxID=3233056 RepID=UPI003F974864